MALHLAGGRVCSTNAGSVIAASGLTGLENAVDCVVTLRSAVSRRSAVDLQRFLRLAGVEAVPAPDNIYVKYT